MPAGGPCWYTTDVAKTGIFGGTFNPVHLGHLRAAEEIRERLALDLVLWVPSAEPPHKHPRRAMAPAEDRLEMTRLATAGNPCFRVLDLEMRRPGPSYTLTTLETIRRERPEDELFFIIGADAFRELQSWHRPSALFPLASFALVGRPPDGFAGIWETGFIERPSREALERFAAGEDPVLTVATTVADGRAAVLVNISPLSISATGIRDRIAKGRSVRYLLPGPVESYILGKGLYGRNFLRRTVP